MNDASSREWAVTLPGQSEPRLLGADLIEVTDSGALVLSVRLDENWYPIIGYAAGQWVSFEMYA